MRRYDASKSEVLLLGFLANRRREDCLAFYQWVGHSHYLIFSWSTIQSNHFFTLAISSPAFQCCCPILSEDTVVVQANKDEYSKTLFLLHGSASRARQHHHCSQWRRLERSHAIGDVQARLLSKRHCKGTTFAITSRAPSTGPKKSSRTIQLSGQLDRCSSIPWRRVDFDHCHYLDPILLLWMFVVWYINVLLLLGTVLQWWSGQRGRLWSNVKNSTLW